MRYQGDHQLVPVVLDIYALEQPAQARDIGKSGNAGRRFRVGLLNDSANQVDLAFAQADIGRLFVLADLRLGNAAQILVIIHLRDIEIDMQRDLIVLVHLRKDLHVHAHIQICELSVDQGTDAHAGHTGLEAAARGRNFLADLKTGFLIIDRADLRRLQHCCCGIVQDCLERRSRQAGNREIGAGYVAQRIERNICTGW